jgi:hypothetical protein
MKLGDSKAIKVGQWFPNEIFQDDDINFVGESIYQNFTDLLATLAEQGIANGSTPNIIIGGLLLEFSATLTSNLRAGAAVSYQGYYLDIYGTWGFQVSAQDVFSVMVPDDQSVTVDAGGSQGRVDTIEIRPTEISYNSLSRSFKDPVTGLVTSANVKTRKEYGVEVQILKGTEGGAPVAPTHTAGWIKVAEISVAGSASSITQADIKDVRGSWGWTTEANDTTYPLFSTGFVLPRFTTTQRDNLQNPEVGMLVYNTTQDRLNVRADNGASPRWEYPDGTDATT